MSAHYDDIWGDDEDEDDLMAVVEQSELYIIANIDDSMVCDDKTHFSPFSSWSQKVVV